MGRRDKSYQKDLHQQAYDKLTSMLSFGDSKKADMEKGISGSKIYSYRTYQTYWENTKKFIRYVEQEHPDCATIKHARQYVNEYLEHRENETIIKNGKEVPKLSAWTLHTEAASLRKLYGIKPSDDDFYHPPERKRSDIVRSRTDAVRDSHFSETNNAELINFCRGTGLRREGISKIKGDCLYDHARIESKIQSLENKSDLSEEEKRDLVALKNTRYFNQDYFVRTKEKGAKIRYAVVIGPHTDQIIARIKSTPDDRRVFEHVNSSADIHSYRSDYARALYKIYAREIDKIPYDKVNRGSGKRYQSDVYVCREDEKGRRLDRKSMWLTSLSLGHSRINIIAENYLRGL